MYLGNHLAFKILSEAANNPQLLERCPLYINFLNCKLNFVPEFLYDRKEIGIVLQKQFENLVIDYRGLSVVLFFDGRPHNLYIDLLTVCSIEWVNELKMDFDNRLSSGYIASILSVGENSYMQNMKDLAIKMSSYDKSIVKLLPKQREFESKKGTVIQIEDVIKPSLNK